MNKTGRGKDEEVLEGIKEERTKKEIEERS